MPEPVPGPVDYSISKIKYSVVMSVKLTFSSMASIHVHKSARSMVEI